MKRTILGAGVLLCVLLFSTCQDGGGGDPLSSDATVKSITIAGRTASLGTPSKDWMAIEPGAVYLPASLMQGAKVQVSVVSGSKVFYARGAAGAEPYFVSESSFDFDNQDLLYVEIFSANLDAYLIYAVQVVKTTPIISEVQFSMVYSDAATNTHTVYRPAASLGTPNADYTQAVAGELNLGKTERFKAGVANTLHVTPEAGDTTFRVAVAAEGAAPEFTGDPLDSESPASTITGNNGDYLYIESTSGDAVNGEKVYYKIKLVEKDDALSLTSISVNGNEATLGTMGVANLVGNEAWGSYLFGAGIGGPALVADKNANITVSATAASSNAIVKYGLAASDRDYLPDEDSWTTNSDFGKLGAGRKIIALRVENTLGEQAWYRVAVGIGASEAEITGITVGGVPVTSLGTAGVFEYNAMFYMSLFNGTPGAVTLTSKQAGDGSTVIVQATGASTGATVRYDWGGIANFGMTMYLQNGAWNTTGEGLFNGGALWYGFVPVAAGVNNALIYVEVTAENGCASKIYAIKCTVELPQLITGITVGGVAASSLGTPGTIDMAAYGLYSGIPGTVTLTSAQAGDGSTVVVAPVGIATGATVRYNWGAPFGGSNYIASEWSSTPDGLFVGGSVFGDQVVVAPGVDGALIFIEVTSADGDVVVYALNCVVAD